jgi:tRNA-dihydrouridine synthase C
MPGPSLATPAPTLIVLAPMEGVLDHDLRDVLTGFGGIDRCVSEFIRVTDQLLPRRVFLRLMPELARAGEQRGRTPAGTPVRAQLLGSDPACLADNAARLAELGPHGIDLNFGCPAKTVNRHRGGAVLLDEPELVFAIVSAVRRAVPATMPVSAKMRLGHRDESKMLDNARAIADAGASELTVHARTKQHGYRPPAYWDRIAHIRQAVALPVIANGEIWTPADAQRCRAESGCDALMLGRGQVADPGLALRLRGRPGPTWPDLLAALARYAALITPRVAERHRGGRIKQWLMQLARRHEPARVLFERARTLREAAAIDALLLHALHGVPEAVTPNAPPARSSSQPWHPTPETTAATTS